MLLTLFGGGDVINYTESQVNIFPVPLEFSRGCGTHG